MKSINRKGYRAFKWNGVYVLEHRFIIEQYFSRSLSKEEAIHHKDGDKTNNRIENLEVCETHGSHTKKHHQDLFIHQSIAFRGKHFSKKTEFVKDDSRLIGNKYRLGKTPWNKGRAWKPEERKMLSKSHKGKHKVNCGSFKKGSIPWNKKS